MTTKINATLVVIEHSKNGDSALLSFETEEYLEFKEGQFIMLTTPNYIIEAKPAKRAYSIASTQQQYNETKQLKLIVKKVSEKGMSNYLTQQINTGEHVIIEGSFGSLINDYQHNKYLFISMGSGIAALYPHFLHITREMKTYNKVVNIFGEKHKLSIVPSIQKVLKQEVKNVKNITFLSRDERVSEQFRIGHVQDALQEALDYLGDNNFVTFLCGSPAMVADVKNKLIAKGIDESMIKVEQY